MGAAARCRAEREFSREQYAETVNRLYRTL
jgi:hypothetical protein